MHPDRKNAAGHRERVTKAVGTIASCILAGSCIQAGDRNPELASLIVSGHVDVLSAKVCTLSLDLLLEGDGSSSESGTSEDFRPAGAPRAPRLVDPEVEHRGYRGSSGSTTSTQSEALTEFLEAGPSAAADEASCLASGALPDEPPGGGETASVRRESSACLSRGARLGRGGRPRGRRVSGYRES
jgi:hypothetical protein